MRFSRLLPSVCRQSQTPKPPSWKSYYRGFVATAALTTSLISQTAWIQTPQVQAAASCQLSAEAIAQKEAARQAAMKGEEKAKERYKALVREHAAQMQQCRSRTWPQTQAIWLRLYPCDLQPGAIENVMDRIINRGYNQVYVEVFYNGQVLLPMADNPTAWPSVVRVPGSEKADLLAQAIEKGRERGLKVYAWMFSMNFGYSYSQRPDRQQAIARNGRGETTTGTRNIFDPNGETGVVVADETFIDPYSIQAKQDYYQLVQAVTRRRPDGVLFDYIRYPRGTGAASVSSKVHDLWIYGDSAQQALYQRALNNKGLELIRRFLGRGYITAGDVAAADKLYPQEAEPMWQGRIPSNLTKSLPATQRQPYLQQELWLLTVAHALQGIVDFLNLAVSQVQQQGMTAGAVFFPDGNQTIGQGFDSRLQPWERFPASIEWHPMSYGVCGASDPSCIVSLVRRVVSMAPPGAKITPAIAGAWGQSLGNRPPLELQMQAIRQAAPQINAVSHFAYSWQDPQSDRDRKSCKAQ